MSVISQLAISTRLASRSIIPISRVITTHSLNRTFRTSSTMSSKVGTPDHPIATLDVSTAFLIIMVNTDEQQPSIGSHRREDFLHDVNAKLPNCHS
jgi:hypothetical protein